MKAGETTRGETTKEQESRHSGGERDIRETARISRFHNKTNDISPSKWYRGHKETNTAKQHR